MMESSRKLESLLYISFRYGGLQRIFSTLPSSLLCQSVMGKQRLIWPTGDTFGIYTVYVIVTFYIFPEYVLAGGFAND